MPERIILPIHGTDHIPGGPDPIPGYGWARRSRGFADANQTISNNFITAVTMTNDYNMDVGDSGAAYFQPEVSGNGIEIMQQGYILVTCGVNWFEGFTQDIGIGILDQSSAGHWSVQPHISFTTIDHTFCMAKHYDVGEIVVLAVFQSSGSNKNVDAAWIEMLYLDSWAGTPTDEMDPDA